MAWFGQRLRSLRSPNFPRPGRSESLATDKEAVLTDAEIARKGRVVDLESKETEVERLRAEVEKLKGELDTEKENRRLRHGIAIGALIVMCAQVLASNAIFVWYGDTNGWDISPAAISAWMGTTVIQVVSVVLVIVNYLFPNRKGG